MCWDVSTETTPTARKAYLCNAAEWINNSGMGEDDFAPEDWDKIITAKAEGWKILPGTKYVKVKGIYEGEFSTFRGRPELCDICHKYDLYDC